MQEYWVNVYDHPNGNTEYAWHEKKEILIMWHNLTHYGKLKYRIHVKMKPVIYVNGNELLKRLTGGMNGYRGA